MIGSNSGERAFYDRFCQTHSCLFVLVSNCLFAFLSGLVAVRPSWSPDDRRSPEALARSRPLSPALFLYPLFVALFSRLFLVASDFWLLRIAAAHKLFGSNRFQTAMYNCPPYCLPPAFPHLACVPMFMSVFLIFTRPLLHRLRRHHLRADRQVLRLQSRFSPLSWPSADNLVHHMLLFAGAIDFLNFTGPHPLQCFCIRVSPVSQRFFPLLFSGRTHFKPHKDS